MEEGRLALVLTRLAGSPQLRADELAELNEGDWTALDARAGEHRLRPLLHARWQRQRAIPAAVLACWAEAYRDSALMALAQRRALIALVERLAGEGIAVLALKGAWLAWNVYRAPALRPLRDLDLLVRPDQIARARALLCADGWREPEPTALRAEEWLARCKHLPELVSREGHWLDLHARLWDPLPDAPALPATLWDDAVADRTAPALRFPGPEDMLMHLVLHAAAHRFDAGPLLLADVDRLVAAHPFDWPRLFARARAERWERPLALVLAATRQWGCQGLWRGPAEVPDVPAAVLADLPHLLAKPLAARAADIGAAKRGSRLALREKARRVWDRRRRHESGRDYLGWLAQEARLALAARGDAALAERAARIARLDAYLAAG